MPVAEHPFAAFAVIHYQVSNMPLPHHPPAAAVRLPSAAKEHLVLIRQLARLQADMTELMNHHAAELQRWQRRLMRQSVRLMLERTRAEWNIDGSRDDDGTDALLNDPASAQEADLLICQIGCVMDGFHWRDGTRCKRTHLACRLVDTATPQQALPTSAD
jgi:phytoene dehydrogenase-like protein